MPCPCDTKIQACGNCQFFVAGGKCLRVRGEIHATDVCSLWDKGQPQELGTESNPTFEKSDVFYTAATTLIDWPPKIEGLDNLATLDVLKVPATKFPPDPQPSHVLGKDPPEPARMHDPIEPYLSFPEAGAGALQEAQQFEESKHPRDAEGKFANASYELAEKFHNDTPEVDKFTPNPNKRQMLGDDGNLFNLGGIHVASGGGTHANLIKPFHKDIGFESKEGEEGLDLYRAFDKFRQDSNSLRVSTFSPESVGFEVLRQEVNAKQLRLIRDLSKNGVDIYFDIYTESEHFTGSNYHEFIASLRQSGLIREITIQEAQMFEESKHPRDAEGKFSDRAGATSLATLEQERDALTKQLIPLSHEYKPFEKYSPEDASLKWVNRGIRTEIGRIDERLANLNPIIGAPLLPLGKNTHPHDPRGWRNNQVTDIILHEPKANEWPSTRESHLKQQELVKTLWNQLPDDERDMLKTFEMAPIETSDDWRAGITMGYYSDENKKVWLGTMNDLSSQDLRGTFIHEMAHAKWREFEKKNPEKIEQFVKDVKGFPSSSKYSKWHVTKIKYYEKADKKWKKTRDWAISNNSWGELAEKTYEVVQRNMKIFRNTYYSELHSELQMHVMGATKQEGKKGERKIPNNLKTSIKAYKRLHDIE